jgi:hypothetical protein
MDALLKEAACAPIENEQSVVAILHSRRSQKRSLVRYLTHNRNVVHHQLSLFDY